MAKSLAWLQAPQTQIEQAFQKSMEMLPSEMRFKRDYESWKFGGRG
jgi:hypothetical protein